MAVIPEVGKLRQEDCIEVKASLATELSPIIKGGNSVSVGRMAQWAIALGMRV